MGILIWLLFKIFIMISQISVKVQFERWLHNELIFVMQTMQNLIDQWDLAIVGTTPTDLEITHGLLDTLVLSGDDWQYIIERTCLGTGADCSISLTHIAPPAIPAIYYLTDIRRIQIDNLFFKLLPYGSQTISDNITHQWFRMYVDAKLPTYNEDKRWYRVEQRMQTFFNVRVY